MGSISVPDKTRRGSVYLLCQHLAGGGRWKRGQGHHWLLAIQSLRSSFSQEEKKAEAGVMMNNRHCLKHAEPWNHARSPERVTHAYAMSRTIKSTRIERRFVGAKCQEEESPVQNFFLELWNVLVVYLVNILEAWIIHLKRESFIPELYGLVWFWHCRPRGRRQGRGGRGGGWFSV